jgi:hypothetical protein
MNKIGDLRVGVDALKKKRVAGTALLNKITRDERE